jgi:hypothetical protein
MSNGNGRIKFQSMNQPREEKKSQIEEYLDFMEDRNTTYATAKDDIVKTISQLRQEE